jgi:hypothetical protein
MNKSCSHPRQEIANRPIQALSEADTRFEPSRFFQSPGIELSGGYKKNKNLAQQKDSPEGKLGQMKMKTHHAKHRGKFEDANSCPFPSSWPVYAAHWQVLELWSIQTSA